MKRISKIIAACVVLSCSGTASAQEQGNVVIHSDPRLSVLLKKSRLLVAVAASAPRFNEVPVKNSPPPVNPAVPPVVHQVLPSAPPPAVQIQHHEVRTVYMGKGFRVQIYNGPDRAKALSVKTEFMRHFPGVRSYLIYNAPAFRVRVGDYRNRGDAEGMLREANSMYSPSMIVPDVVTISTY